MCEKENRTFIDLVDELMLVNNVWHSPRRLGLHFLHC